MPQEVSVGNPLHEADPGASHAGAVRCVMGRMCHHCKMVNGECEEYVEEHDDNETLCAACHRTLGGKRYRLNDVKISDVQALLDSSLLEGSYRPSVYQKV